MSEKVYIVFSWWTPFRTCSPVAPCNDWVRKSVMLVALRPSLRLLHEKFSLPAPKHALLSNIFNDELSDPRNITDRITRIAKRKLLLMTFSAMIEKVSQVSQLVDNWYSRVLTAGVTWRFSMWQVWGVMLLPIWRTPKGVDNWTKGRSRERTRERP